MLGLPLWHSSARYQPPHIRPHTFSRTQVLSKALVARGVLLFFFVLCLSQVLCSAQTQGRTVVPVFLLPSAPTGRTRALRLTNSFVDTIQTLGDYIAQSSPPWSADTSVFSVRIGNVRNIDDQLLLDLLGITLVEARAPRRGRHAAPADGEADDTIHLDAEDAEYDPALLSDVEVMAHPRPQDGSELDSGHSDAASLLNSSDSVPEDEGGDAEEPAGPAGSLLCSEGVQALAQSFMLGPLLCSQDIQAFAESLVLGAVLCSQGVQVFE